MFKRLAKFWLLKPRRISPGLRDAMPANDNLLVSRRRRIPSPALACHWSLTDGGTRLGCRWQPETPAPTALDSSDLSGKTTRLLSRKRSGLAVTPTYQVWS
jgi:hypothetical protein